LTVLYIGKRNFVDSAKLEVVVETLDESNPETAKKIREWRDAGGQPATALTQKLHELTHDPVAWLVEDLLHIVPELLAGSVACDDTTKPCPGLDYYERCKVNLDDADVVFSTHAMLCLSTIRTHTLHSGLFPTLDAIFVDEAQDLEGSMANAAGSDVSMRHLSAELRNGADIGHISERLANKLEAAVAKCRQSLDRIEGDCFIVPGRENEYPAFAQVREDADVLVSLLGKIKQHEIADATWFAKIQNWQRALEKATSGKYTVRLTYSPKLRLPSISVGPSYLRNYFQTLWNNVKSAGLLSATLYAWERHDDWSAWWIRRNLCVPKDRYREAPPFVAPWIYTTPTLFVPSEINAADLARPKDEESDERFEQWHDIVARTLKRIVVDPGGGTLILCNSYDEIAALAERLTSLGTRLIAQAADESVTRIKSIFVDKARNGKRPIWLATGGAWTGLDLMDETTSEPTKDNLLTDLVIVRLPLGRSRSVVHQTRVEKLGLGEEEASAGFLLRQGIGRLIRREGVLNRRLWFLDGRVYSKGLRGVLFRKIANSLQSYPKRQVIAFPA
jgi:ATP-dependent DNA helicase DinG